MALRNNLFFYLAFAAMIAGCSTNRLPVLPHRGSEIAPIAGVVSYLDTLDLQEREDWIKKEILAGHIPKFLTEWAKIETNITAANGELTKATYYVTPDYLAIGRDTDFFRIPLTPKTAQAIADEFHCFLPTRKMVDDIYQAAAVKLEPMPLTEEREKVSTFFIHHRMIEQRRDGRAGLIAGIKKDVVISYAIARDKRPNRVAIYGWHKSDGLPIQPLYTGHVDWYVDYSHGIRLVYEMIKVDGRWMHYEDVLNDKELKGLLCDEEICGFSRY
ncbi:hypothetical protein [Parapedobacter sp.]